MRLKVEDAEFIPKQGHLLWPTITDVNFPDYIVQDQGYTVHCKVYRCGSAIFSGGALMKLRRDQINNRVVLVILVPHTDLGSVGPDTQIDITIGTAEIE